MGLREDFMQEVTLVRIYIPCVTFTFKQNHHYFSIN